MTTMELIEKGIGHNCLSDAYDLGRADALGEIATRLEEELTMVMPRDKVKYVMYKVHTVLEQLNEQKPKTRRYVLDSGEYCWQECCSTDMCKECARLNNGRMDYFDNTFIN